MGVESFQELFDADFQQGLNNYLCLAENRAMCRTVSDAWVPPPSGAPTQADPTTAGDATTGAVATTPKVPEIDSCCGHDGYSSTPFDSELRTCCEDGQVRAYEFEGEDPCAAASDDFYFGNDYGFKK